MFWLIRKAPWLLIIALFVASCFGITPLEAYNLASSTVTAVAEATKTKHLEVGLALGPDAYWGLPLVAGTPAGQVALALSALSLVLTLLAVRRLWTAGSGHSDRLPRSWRWSLAGAHIDGTTHAAFADSMEEKWLGTKAILGTTAHRRLTVLNALAQTGLNAVEASEHAQLQARYDEGRQAQERVVAGYIDASLRRARSDSTIKRLVAVKNRLKTS